MATFYIFLVISLVEVLVLLFFIVNFLSRISSIRHGAPYVPIPRYVVETVLKAGRVGAGDILYDLGSGDGRVLLVASKQFGIREGIGYEISLWPYLKSKLLAHRAGARNLRFYRQSLFDADCSRATAVYMYLFPELINKVAPSLATSLKRGARIICPSFSITNPETYELALTDQATVRGYTIFVYTKI